MLTEATIRVEETLVNGIQVEGHVTAKTQAQHKGIALKDSKASNPLIYESCSDSSGYLGSWESTEGDEDDEDDEDWSSAVSELSSSDDEEGWSSAASHCSEDEDISGKEQEDAEVDQLVSDDEEGGWSSAASHCSSEKDEDRVDQLDSDDSEGGDDESDERINRFCRAKGNSAIGSRSSSPSPPLTKLKREENVVEMSTFEATTTAREEADKVKV